MRNLLILFFVISCNTFVLAQPGWNWPEDKATAEEKNVLYTDYLKQGNCQMSIEPNRWLMQNVPGLHVSIYQNAIKILHEFPKNDYRDSLELMLNYVIERNV